MIRIATICAMLALAGCAAIDQKAVDAGADRIEPMVRTDCSVSGGVKMGNTLAGSLVPVPGAGLVATGLNAGWDVACADPEEVARIISTKEEVGKALVDRLRDQAR